MVIPAEDVETVFFDNPGTYGAPREIAEIGRVRALAFAGLTHDVNRLYLLENTAPPTAVAILTTPLLAKIAEQLIATGIKREVFRFPLHLSEEIEFSRPLPQQGPISLDATAEWEGHARGAILKVAIAGSENGQPVFRSVSRILMRHVRLSMGTEVSKIAKRSGVAALSPRKSVPVEIEPLFPFLYEASTGIVHPIHTDDGAAKAAGLRGIIIPGSATLALAACSIAAEEADGELTRLLSLSAVFGAPVYPGHTIAVHLLERRNLEGRIAIGFAVETEQDGYAIRDGNAVFRASRGPA